MYKVIWAAAAVVEKEVCVCVIYSEPNNDTRQECYSSDDNEPTASHMHLT